jgi:SAM-dependent methyltransferase
MAKRRRLDVSKDMRKTVARYVRSTRRLDRFHRLEERLPLGWSIRRSVGAYNHALRLEKHGTSIEKIVERKIAENGGKPIDILDVGCGHCIFLKQLKERFGDRVNLEGITLARPLPARDIKKLADTLPKPASRRQRKAHEAYIGKIKRTIADSKEFHRRVRRHNIKVHVGLAETHDYGKKYDLIFSVAAFSKSDVRQALRNTLAHLKEGGEAYLEFGRQEITQDDLRWLERRGIDVTDASDKPGLLEAWLKPWHIYYFKKRKTR